MNKIIRSVCYFSDTADESIAEKLRELLDRLSEKGFSIQTKRACFPIKDFAVAEKVINPEEVFIGLGSFSYQELSNKVDTFFETKNTHFNLDLTNENITKEHIDVLFEIISKNASKTFNFTYSFNNPSSSPYFPSANFDKNGFAIGLQTTDLAANCASLEEWFSNMSEVWDELNGMFEDREDFLGIDSSIAPLFAEESSLINFIQKLGMSFDESILTDTYTKISQFIKENNPKPIGLCGLMFPCLEDFELANEYENGNFTIERNIFLSLHSGLGIDTYPIGIDEIRDKLESVLKLIQALSNKYSKPLSARFVSDGKAKIGEMTDFKNEYLKDVVVRKL